MKGQIVTMVDRAYLTQAMPMLVVWGSDDVVIPAKHAENAARIAPRRRRRGARRTAATSPTRTTPTAS